MLEWLRERGQTGLQGMTAVLAHAVAYTPVMLPAVQATCAVLVTLGVMVVILHVR